MATPRSVRDSRPRAIRGSGSELAGSGGNHSSLRRPPCTTSLAAVYPEIYAIHVGGRYGDLSPFDFWPARKEVFVEDDPVAVLTALNDRGITRLAVPDVAPSPFDFAQAVSAGWSERNALLERLRSAFAYSGSGRVVKHDIAVSCVDPATSVNPSFVLDPQAALDAFSGLVPQDFEHLWPNAAFDNEIWLSAFAARIEEQPREARSRAASLRRTLLENGCTTETFRRVAADEALGMLVAGNR